MQYFFTFRQIISGFFPEKTCILILEAGMNIKIYSIIIVSVLFLISNIAFGGEDIITAPDISNTVISKISSSVEPYVFVTQWGSIGDGDGQFGGIYIAPESTFIITDETLKCLKDKIWYKITKEIIEKLPDEIDKSKLEIIVNKVFYEEEKFKRELTSLSFNEDEIQIILKLASRKLGDEKLKILETLKNREFDKDNDHEFEYTLEELNFNVNEIFLIAEASALKRVSDRVVNGPMYIAVDKACNVYVSDFFNGRIQKFSSEGNFLTKWRCNSCPWGIAIDSKDYVYIVDKDDSCIQKFDSEGNFITQWGKDGEFDLMAGITVDSEGYIYASNVVYLQGKYQVEIHKFNSNGDFIKKWGLGEHFGSMAIDPMGNLFILFKM